MILLFFLTVINDHLNVVWTEMFLSHILPFYEISGEKSTYFKNYMLLFWSVKSDKFYFYTAKLLM